MMQQLQRVFKMIRHQKALRGLVQSYFFFQEHTDKSSYGSISEEDERGIERAIALAAPHAGPIIEVGTLFGHTTNLLAARKATDKALIAIENYAWNPFALPQEAHRLFLHRTLRYVREHANVSIYEDDAASFYRANASLRPSLIFIDAEHDYASVKRDIDWALSVNCPVIAGHDYLPIHPGVCRAVEEAFGTEIEVYGSVWVHHRG
ncbi:class I SAM-dependent methyltransferase [Neolewinella lacunae]|uniref:Class I SAM-dependent methyltransferase n=1 Tax=Neolewinella lacunae TaxID=1517758 RepID=A0A923PPB8_9BACT|nr:class I SAM-dependent methyltransferase [Neolewinella lacunae]MBC6994999.1 class I SAM-dependent methyltransferase [Neolewinella lacunae]MDN3633230.1 class I SAM-dependent methyltransferase [Neolewinella lacunae]